MRIDGEADAVESAFVADEVATRPIRAKEHHRLDVQVLAIVRGNLKRTVAKGALKAPKPRTHPDTLFKDMHVISKRLSDRGLEDTPGSARVDHGEDRSRQDSWKDPEEDSRPGPDKRVSYVVLKRDHPCSKGRSAPFKKNRLVQGQRT